MQTTTLFQILAQVAEKREKSAAGAAALEYLECIFARKYKAKKYKNNEDKYENKWKQIIKCKTNVKKKTAAALDYLESFFARKYKAEKYKRQWTQIQKN